MYRVLGNVPRHGPHIASFPFTQLLKISVKGLVVIDKLRAPSNADRAVPQATPTVLNDRSSAWSQELINVNPLIVTDVPQQRPIVCQPVCRDQQHLRVDERVYPSRQQSAATTHLGRNPGKDVKTC